MTINSTQSQNSYVSEPLITITTSPYLALQVWEGQVVQSLHMPLSDHDPIPPVPYPTFGNLVNGSMTLPPRVGGENRSKTFDEGTALNIRTFTAMETASSVPGSNCMQALTRLQLQV